MKKKLIIIIVSLILVLLVGAIIRGNILEHQKQEQVNNMRSKIELCVEKLGIDGEFSYETDKVIVREMHVNYTRLISYLALYNEFNAEHKATMEQVLDEYEKFCNGEDGTKALDSVLEFNPSIDVFSQLEYSYSYGDYLMDIGICLSEKYESGNDSEITVEQEQEASEYVAKRIHEEIENE